MVYDMIGYPHISPEIFSIGPFSVRWYGMMYILGFVTGWFLGCKRIKERGFMTLVDFESLLTWIIVGVILGARLGYVLFYNLPVYLEQPLDIFKVWEGGMSFHGGLLGVLTALWIYSRKKRMHFFALVDFIAPLVPTGLFFGRIGNFINGELWGNVTDVPWGMIFPSAGNLPRHPSQLYEALLEGALLFIILWIFSSKKRPCMSVSGLFALCYGCFRFFLEFFRQPDVQLGYLAGDFLTMGMVLCLPMIAIGIILLAVAYGKKNKEYI